MAREGIILKCTETGQETYITTKNKKLHPERFEVRKYNPKVRRYTLYREKK
ncbi:MULTISPECIES: 50S ribosomal protein L33 [unclassified Mycoplasma]|uniref:50S ribosomal protein L33 n=1 Tax=unclassified Mycoplasma TaxID=2683645 RepID=UPI000FDEF719